MRGATKNLIVEAMKRDDTVSESEVERITKLIELPGALVDVANTCAMLGGISTFTLMRIVEDGDLRPVMIRARKMFASTEILEYISGR